MLTRLLCVLLLTFGLGLPAWAAEPAQKRDQENPKPERARSPKMDLQVKGGKAVRVEGRRAGDALDKLPGAKRISFAEWRDLKEIPASGLFLVDTDFVPFGLAQELKKAGLVLREDGKLNDQKGKPVTLFIAGETFEVQPDKAAATPERGMLGEVADLFMGTAEAANPYPFSMFSWSMWWQYNGGFCRDYQAWTRAESWGPEQGGARPHTRIAYIETRAEIGSHRDRDSCFNCDYKSSYAQWDIGCFWPAHGTGGGWHYANWTDGGFSATRTWSW